jgi:hypothetical protein
MGMQVIQILTQFLIMQNILGIFVYETNTMDALAEVVQLLDPTYELIQK